MKTLQRLLSVLCVLSLLLSFIVLPVSALEGDPVPPPASHITIDGQDYPIVYTNPNVNTFADSSVGYDDVVFVESTYKDNKTGEVHTFDPNSNSIVLNDYNSLTFSIVFTLPKTFSRGDIFDFNFGILFLNCGFCKNTSGIVLSNSNSTSRKFYNLTDNEIGDSYALVGVNGVKATESFDTVTVLFIVQPKKTAIGTAVSLVDITTVSEASLLSSIIDWLKGIKEGITELPSKISNAFKSFFDDIKKTINNIKNWFDELGEKIEGFFIKLVDDIKALFIPSDDFFTQYSEKFKEWSKQHFGLVYEIIDLVSDVFDKILSFSPSGAKITLPEISFPIKDKKIVLVEQTTYDFNALLNEVSALKILHSVYFSFLYAMFFYWLYRLGTKSFIDIFGGGNE